jgi:hypothetical protein
VTGYRRRLGCRLLLIALAAGYLAVMLASYARPFSPGLGNPLAFGGFAAAVVQMYAAGKSARDAGADLTLPFARRRRSTLIGPEYVPDLRTTLRGRWDLDLAAALILLIAGAALACGWAGISPDTPNCHTGATCLKGDIFRVQGDAYYRQYPYDAQGNDEPDAPWVRISHAEYVEEAGTLLRGGALFGVFALVLGMAVNIAAEGAAVQAARVEVPKLDRRLWH